MYIFWNEIMVFDLYIFIANTIYLIVYCLIILMCWCIYIHISIKGFILFELLIMMTVCAKKLFQLLARIANFRFSSICLYKFQ